jgi:hypothetical protein
MDAGSGGTWRKLTAEAWPVIIVLAVTAIVAALVLVATWGQAAKIEAAKTAMTVLAVSVVGSLVTVVIERYRQSQKDLAEERVRLEQNHEDERARQEENWRRDVERLRDAKSREDALLRSLLQETLRTYNRVKRTRRLLDAHTTSADGRSLHIEVYDAHLQELMDEQLAFEELKRLTWVSGSNSEGLPDLTRNYETIEKYLNKILSEYQKHRHGVESHSPLNLTAELPRLLGFFESRYSYEGHDIGFELNVSSQMDEIIRRVQETLLRPLHLPDAS